MSKHKRAVAMHRKEALRIERLLANTGANRSFEDDLGALTYTLRVLEAVEGVEAWMVEYLRDQAKRTKPNEDVRFCHRARFLGAADALQAILDAKADPDA